MNTSQIGLSIGESPTLALNDKAKKLIASGKPVINLGVGEPKNPTPDNALRYAKSRLKTKQIKYGSTSGDERLKEAIIEYTLENYGRKPHKLNILVTVGAKQAIFNSLFSIVNPGDEVVLLAPYWVSYPEMVKMVRGISIPVFPNQEDLHLDINDIKKKINSKTKAIILNSPNNPSGQISPPEFIKALVELCETQQIYLIMDDIYHKLILGNANWVPGFGYSEKEIDNSIIIVVNGISKTYGMTGFRIGWVVASKKLIKVMTNLQSQTTSGASIVSQEAALGALTGSQDVVVELVKNIKYNRDITMTGLGNIPRVKVAEPQGAFYCLPDFRAYNENSMALADYILEKAHVAVVPGAPFGMEGYLRLSFAGDAEDIEEALSRIKRLLS